MVCWATAQVSLVLSRYVISEMQQDSCHTGSTSLDLKS